MANQVEQHAKTRRATAKKWPTLGRRVPNVRNLLRKVEFVEAFARYVREIDSTPEAPGWIAASLGDYRSADSEPPLFLRRLYVLEPDDLSDFTLGDLLLAWEYRDLVCGSMEAAAELYALYRMAAGMDDEYLGGDHYSQAVEVQAIFQAKPELSPEQEKSQSPVKDESKQPPVLTLAQVRALASSELMLAWENRPDSFASLEAAAEALAMLRWYSSADSEQRPLVHYLKHPLILALEDDLPRMLTGNETPAPERELEVLRQDRRQTRVQTSVVRTGQRDFRGEVFSRYGGACCVTGCTIARLLEAAHILPFRGSQTDHAENGLLLRVDLHRLYDEYLISIEPSTQFLVISASIDDPVYRDLHGTPLFRLSAKPRQLYLEDHFRRFTAAERQRSPTPTSRSDKQATLH